VSGNGAVETRSLTTGAEGTWVLAKVARCFADADRPTQTVGGTHGCNITVIGEGEEAGRIITVIPGRR